MLPNRQQRRDGEEQYRAVANCSSQPPSFCHQTILGLHRDVRERDAVNLDGAIAQ
jgi:hypothetical protein